MVKTGRHCRRGGGVTNGKTGKSHQAASGDEEADQQHAACQNNTLKLTRSGHVTCIVIRMTGIAAAGFGSAEARYIAVSVWLWADNRVFVINTPYTTSGSGLMASGCD